MARKTDLHLKGFVKMQKAFGPAFVARLASKVHKKNLYIAKFAEGRLRRQIEAGKSQKNAALTIIIKSGSKPLFDYGKLLKSIRSTQWDNFSFSVGVDKLSRDGTNVPAILESGAVVPVSDEMRKFFWAKFKESKGKILPLKKSTTQIVIPPRPFLKTALIEDPVFVRIVLWEWAHAIQEAFGPVTMK
ncbi:MAG: hypothetical protein KAS32_19710 [Candidatus Peribacteraceae bacterium]|nr:hypothetical protein [Candidatus Peribacteraceae bacterium]